MRRRIVEFYANETTPVTGFNPPRQNTATTHSGPVLALLPDATAEDRRNVQTVHDCSATKPDGQEVKLSDYAGKILLIVNVASKCGFTPQYEGLEKLYRTYEKRGFVVLGFPCNQFGGQEPGSAEEIANFCTRTYDVTFPMFAKVDVNGDNAAPVFRALKQAKKGLLGSEAIKWNFTKFLVDRQGEATARYAPATKPEKLAEDIEAALKE